MYRPAPEDDDARPEKAYAGNDLSRNARWVDHNGALNENVAESVLTDQQDQGRRGPDDGLRAQPGALVLDFAFQADERGQPECDEQLDELTGALPGPPKNGGSAASQRSM